MAHFWNFLNFLMQSVEGFLSENHAWCITTSPKRACTYLLVELYGEKAVSIGNGTSAQTATTVRACREASLHSYQNIRGNVT